MRAKAAFAFPHDAGAIVLVELDGEHDGLEAAVLRCGGGLRGGGGARRDRRRATTPIASGCGGPAGSCRPSLREAHAFKVVGGHRAFRAGSIAEMLRRVDAIGARHDLLTATFGHAGDGNLHVNVLTDEDHRDAAGRGAHRRRRSATCSGPRSSCGGTLSGEHGIGIAKARYMRLGAVARSSSSGSAG